MPVKRQRPWWRERLCAIAPLCTSCNPHSNGRSLPSWLRARYPAPQGYEGGAQSDGKRCYVGNINYDVREDEIRNAFQEVRTGARATHRLFAPL